MRDQLCAPFRMPKARRCSSAALRALKREALTQLSAHLSSYPGGQGLEEVTDLR